MFVITAAQRTKTLVYWEVEEKNKEKETVGQMSHSSLDSQQVDVCMFGTHEKNKPTGQSRGS